LRSLAGGGAFPIIDVPLRGPRPAELGDDLSAVRSWIASLQGDSHDGRHYELRYTEVGGRLIGRNRLPSRAVVSTYAQAWSLLSVGREITHFQGILADCAAEPAILAWVSAHPFRALSVTDGWPAMVAAYRWLDEARGSGRYLREITAPGVDTKFVERNRPVLAAMLGVPPSPAEFVGGLGLRGKPEFVRLRAGTASELLAGVSELSLRVDELADLAVSMKTAVIIENEVTYLSLPAPVNGVVFWGKGFEVSRAGSMPWLRDAAVWYWGDLDTHGFAILNLLRAWLPQTRSFLMDRATLLRHRDRWVREPSPTAAALSRLTTEESAVYTDLVTDRFGESIRLEQERIDWTWAIERLPHSLE
jgi:hypothetical protein